MSLQESLIPSSVNLTDGAEISAEDYQQMIATLKQLKGNDFSKLELESCSIEDELNKVRA